MRHLLILPLMLAPVLPAHAQDADTAIEETFGLGTGPEEFSEIEIEGLTAERLVDAPLMGADGARIGTVEHVLLIEDDSDKLVVGMGGYGDESTRKVLLELGDVQIEESDDGDLRAITALTRPQIDALADYESA